MGGFGPISKVGLFGPILGASRSGLIDPYAIGKVHPDFALIKTKSYVFDGVMLITTDNE